MGRGASTEQVDGVIRHLVADTAAEAPVHLRSGPLLAAGVTTLSSPSRPPSSTHIAADGCHPMVPSWCHRVAFLCVLMRQHQSSRVAMDGGEVRELPEETRKSLSAPRVIRTPDLLIRSPETTATATETHRQLPRTSRGGRCAQRSSLTTTRPDPSQPAADCGPRRFAGARDS